MKERKFLFNFSSRTPVKQIKKDLRVARGRRNIYLTARVIQILRSRGIASFLSPREKDRLIKCLSQARYGTTTPLAQWIPRGYQIARFQMIIKDLYPNQSLFQSTKRDVYLIKEALKQIRREKDKWISDQESSLIYTLQHLGISLK